MDVLLLALAPELDRRYERVYAYLQDHVGRRWPTVDLALHLLCADAVERMQRRGHFDAAAPLFTNGLLYLVPESEQAINSLLTHALKLDEQITRFVLYQDGLDARLVPFCTLVTETDPTDAGQMHVACAQALLPLLQQTWPAQHPLRLYFQGPDGVGKYACARAATAAIAAPLLTVDLARAAVSGADFAASIPLVFRYAHLHHAILFFDGLDSLRDAEKKGHLQVLLDQLANHTGIAILAGQKPWPPAVRQSLGVLTVPFHMPDFAQRRVCWQIHLARNQIALHDASLDALASRFQLTPTQIADATLVAYNLTRLQASQNGQAMVQPELDELFRAARAQTGQDLETLARKIEPHYTWDDIVLPLDTLRQLREICLQVIHRHTVLETWGFDHKLALGKGINVLFAGPSGTGKTMAAEIISHELRLELYKIDLSGVVSKYIGETEKNLSRIFAVAASSNAILFFDEADALFGKRSEVHDAHDRYANLEISYLLQRMEEYSGIVILATNLRKNMDDAFVRRMQCSIDFPFPNEKQRCRIWEKIWPEATPRSPELDLDFMARRFEVTGGNIRNIALTAAFFAAEENSAITMTHLIRATQREYQKMGKVMLAEEFGEYSGLVGRRA
jgi:SpoVK/Ycf46/Vps4 family AAA+-type ATPase